MWGIMKKIIILFLVSMLSQSLSAADWFGSECNSHGRRTPIRSCYSGTDDWLSGGGPAMSLSDALAQDKIIRSLKEQQDKEAVEAAIIAQLHKIPQNIRVAVLETVCIQSGILTDDIRGFQTPFKPVVVKPKRSKSAKKTTQGNASAGKSSEIRKRAHSVDWSFRVRSESPLSPISSPVPLSVK